ncbi:MAG: hypothetical protein R3D98_03540 [Candidatus Krumholzibacteriia bacterium]
MVVDRHPAACRSIMRTLFVILVLLMTGPDAPAAASGAASRQWCFTVGDPSRPGRSIEALAVGPSCPQASCPLLVFGHATMTPCDHYAYLVDALVTAGWLVILPETEPDLVADQAALAADMVLLADLARSGSPELPSDLPPLAAGWALGGHSLGGGAAVLAAAMSAETPPALLLLAPQDRGRPSVIGCASEVSSPTLLISGDQDCLTPPDLHHRPLFAALGASPRAYASLLGGGHCFFAAPCEPCMGGEEDCGQNMTAVAQQALTLALAVPWLAWQGRGDPTARGAVLAALDGPGVAGELVEDAVGALLLPPPRLRLAGSNLGAASVGWRLDAAGPRGPTTAHLFDVRGRRCRRLEPAPAGDGWRLDWDGRDEAGRPAPAGIYLLRVIVGGAVLTSRAVKVD